MQKRCLANFGR